MSLRRWGLFREQVAVQLMVRTLNFYSLSLLVLQPLTFSLVGMLLSRAAGRPMPDLVYNIIGGGVMGMWSGIVFTSSWDIRGDRYTGVLELIVGSPTSLFTLNMIRSFTNVLSGFFSMVLAFLAAVFMYDLPLNEANLPAALVSLLLLLFSTWSISIFLSVFFAASRISGHFVEYLEMPVAILCGFMYPIRILPGWMRTVSSFIPIRWSLEAMNESLLGLANLPYLLGHWGLALLLSFAFIAVTFLMQKKVNDIIRVNGELSAI